MALKRVLFAGLLSPGSSCLGRLRGLENLGVEVTPFDTSDSAGPESRLDRYLSHRTYATPSVIRLNAHLLRTAAKLRPDLVWIDKGNWLYPQVARLLRGYAGFLVQYNTDDLFGEGTPFWLARMSLEHFDLHLTTNRFNVGEINRRRSTSALPHAIRVGMGHDGVLHRPPTQRLPELEGSVVFIGHWEPHTEEFIVALRNAGVPVRVCGNGWRHAKTGSLRETRPLQVELYAETLASASLALCSLSRLNRNESTGRTFEIPAIGGCLLAERTAEHEFLFPDGARAILFTDADELVRKATYYLQHSEARLAIQQAGHAKANDLNLSWEGHAAREWPLVERLLIDRMPLRSSIDDAPFWEGFRAGAPASHAIGQPRSADGRAPESR